MRLQRLPGWVVDDDTSIREEVADSIGAGPERLWELTHMCAPTAAWALDFHTDPSAALDYRDPLPATTLAALARLRKTSR